MRTRGVTVGMETLGRAVRSRRKALGLSQKELSLLAGCGVVFLYELEQGKPTIRMDKLLQILEVLGLGLSLAEAERPILVVEDLEVPSGSGDD